MSQAAAPDGTLEAVLVVFVVAAVVILPSLGLLYTSTSATCSAAPMVEPGLDDDQR